MSVDLKVWANHKLKFNSVKEGIKFYEESIGKKVNQWNINFDEALTKTTEYSKVEFFTNFDVLKSNFVRYGLINIWTNYKFCNQIILLKKTLNIKPIGFWTRYSKWLNLVSDVIDEGDIEKARKYRKNWLLFQEFSHKLVCKLEGERIIYVNDNGYQDEEDLFYQGKSLDEVMRILSEKNEPCELEIFQLYPNEFKSRSTWYFDEVKLNN